MKPLHIIRKESKCQKACSFFFQTFFLENNINNAFVTKISLSNNDEYLKIYYYCEKSDFFFIKKLLRKNLVTILNNILENVSFHKIPKVCFIFDKNYEKILETHKIIDSLNY